MSTLKKEIKTTVLFDCPTYLNQVGIDCGLNKNNLNQATNIDSFVAIATNLVWPVAPDAKV
jgi:hypothetical protein